MRSWPECRGSCEPNPAAVNTKLAREGCGSIDCAMQLGKRMDNRKRSLRILGLLLLAVGILLGVALAGAIAWADLEAEFYGFQTLTQNRLRGLACPPILTMAEAGTISAPVRNPVDQELQLIVRADFSARGPLRSERALVSLAAQETRRLTWTVTADDIDLHSFIFARVYTYPGYQSPMRQATCGILMLDLPLLGGTQVLALTVTASLACMVAGLWLWRSNRPLTRYAETLTSALTFLAGIVLLAIATSWLGWWLPGLVLVLLTILTVSVILVVVASQ